MYPDILKTSFFEVRVLISSSIHLTFFPVADTIIIVLVVVVQL